jgi:hypothetical protein
MKNTFIKSILFLLVIIIVSIFLAPFIKNIEGFKVKTDYLSKTEGTYPDSLDKVLLNNYPQIGKNSVSKDNVTDIWWHYPIFTLPSFKQITNNLRYYNNPDEGTCTRSEFCGALYHDKKNKSNEVFPLSQAEEGPGARVGYFRTEPNTLYYSIPTNENILY